MIFLSAYDDFVIRTLSRIAGPLRRLRYIAELRTPEGYCHWGLARSHGEAAAAAALARAHTETWMAVLRTPVRQLAEQWNGREEIAELARAAGMVPQNRDGGSVRHFNSVVSALAALSRNRRDTSPRAA